MAGTFQDLRHAIRQMRKNPGFVATAVLTLALGIGANVAVFSVMNAILLNPSGIPHPERVVALRTKYSVGDLGNIDQSPADFGDSVSGKDIFTSAAVMQTAGFNYSGDSATPEKLSGPRFPGSGSMCSGHDLILAECFVRKKTSRTQIMKSFFLI